MTNKKKPVQRFDSAKVKATLDANGFLYDTPVVARIGLQIYTQPDGSERREFRPASEVFSWDSLDSYRGKPITLGHVEVNSENAKEVMVGACTGNAYRQWDENDYSDGPGVVCPVTVHDASAIQEAQDKNAAEISVGYTTIDIEQSGWGNNRTGEFFFDNDRPGIKQDELPGESIDWVRFDALQTTIRVNHVALVFRGRAGIAKLNLDASQEFPYDIPVTITLKEDEYMTVKIKLDGSQEHDVPEAVAAHITKLDAQIAEIQGKHDALEAVRDTLQLKVDGIPAEIEKAVATAKADGEALAVLIGEAIEVGVKCDGLTTAKDVKIAYVKQVNGLDVSDKGDAYIEAAFDMAKAGDKMAAQRAATSEGAGSEKNDAKQDGVIDPQKRMRDRANKK